MLAKLVNPIEMSVQSVLALKSPSRTPS